MECLNCKKVIISKDKRNKFCSKSCAAILNNKKFPKRKPHKVKVCKYCDNVLKLERSKRGRVVCDSCQDKRIYSTVKEDSVTKLRTVGEVKILQEGKSRPWTDKVRGYARAWNSKKGKCCDRCGYSKHVEVCHIKPITSFNDTATMAEINDPSNIIFLCPNCHWEQDNL